MRGETLRYAAYGSNLHPTRLCERVSSASFLGSALLADWSLRFHKASIDGSAKCSISPGSAGVYVAVFDMSCADKDVLDTIEGAGIGYSEITLDVPDYGPCFSYSATESHIDDSLVPYDWYKALVLAGAHAHSFPASYVECIRQVPARRDPDDARNLQMWQVVSRVNRA